MTTNEEQEHEDKLMDMYKLQAYIPNDAEGNPLTPFGNFSAGYEAATTEANKRIAELEREKSVLQSELDEADEANQVLANKMCQAQASNNTLREALEDAIDDVTKLLDELCTGFPDNTVKYKQALSKTPAESLQAFESVHYRDAILEFKRQIESNRVWSGMKYTYTPMPEFKQIRCIEAIDAALKEVK